MPVIALIHRSGCLVGCLACCIYTIILRLESAELHPIFHKSQWQQGKVCPWWQLAAWLDLHRNALPNARESCWHFDDLGFDDLIFWSAWLVLKGWFCKARNSGHNAWARTELEACGIGMKTSPCIPTAYPSLWHHHHGWMKWNHGLTFYLHQMIVVNGHGHSIIMISYNPIVFSNSFIDSHPVVEKQRDRKVHKVIDSIQSPQ